MKLLIFNPEHDLCLANGSRDFVAPKSAVEFARSRASVMQYLYSDGLCLSAYDAFPAEGITEVVAWGWNAALKKSLVRGGVAESLLPSDEELALWRSLQHRKTLLPLQHDSIAVAYIADMERLIASGNPRWVLKAPWSGAGRGLHWINGSLCENDRAWLRKTVAAQCCVVAEPWRDVAADFALEYISRNGELVFVGYSLFKAHRGVYRNNVLAADEQIVEILEQKTSHTTLANAKLVVEQWLVENIVPHYYGPLGVDMIADTAGRIHVCEMNLRHTMGMVAHAKVNGMPLQ